MTQNANIDDRSVERRATPSHEKQKRMGGGTPQVVSTEALATAYAAAWCLAEVYKEISATIKAYDGDDDVEVELARLHLLDSAAHDLLESHFRSLGVRFSPAHWPLLPEGDCQIHLSSGAFASAFEQAVREAFERLGATQLSDDLAAFDIYWRDESLENLLAPLLDRSFRLGGLRCTFYDGDVRNLGRARPVVPLVVALDLTTMRLVLEDSVDGLGSIDWSALDQNTDPVQRDALVRLLEGQRPLGWEDWRAEPPADGSKAVAAGQRDVDHKAPSTPNAPAKSRPKQKNK